MDSVVELRSDQGIAQIVIRRPQARNALTWAAMQAFADCVEQAEQLADLRALIVTGEGGAFCAGGDLFELDGYPTRLDGVRLSAVMAEALDRLEALPAPTIAAIEGPALGGGAEMALACDLRVMAEGAALGLMHVRLGITPAWGGGQRLVRLVGHSRALEWLSLARVFAASEALEAGLVNRVVARGQSLDEALALARDLAGQDPRAVAAVKRLVRAGLTRPAQEAMRAERDEFPDLWAAPAHLAASAEFLARRNHRPREAERREPGNR
jgi:enoyl-CoA hydratase